MRVLITAGQVYGRLDDNKLVGNRVRGLWATRFAEWLAERGHYVLLVLPDTYPRDRVRELESLRTRTSGIQVLFQSGFESYREVCFELAPDVAAAVMAAAVVNWIPAEPISGKMPTHGFEVGDTINIPFVLAPRVIQGMKKRNPKLTLIGCKMLIGSTHDQLIDAAYRGVLIPSRCNVVVANDMEHGLRTKYLVHQDRTVLEFDDDFQGFYEALLGHIEDIHYRTDYTTHHWQVIGDGSFKKGSASDVFNKVSAKYAAGFTPRGDGKTLWEKPLVFGSLCVPSSDGTWLVSPREKGQIFTAYDAFRVKSVEDRVIRGQGPRKATLNAPLLIRVAQKYGAHAVLHQHQHLEGVPDAPYFPPGTARDNEREIPGPSFNILGHGFVACLDENLEIIL